MNTADITAGTKYTVNFGGIDFSQGVKVTELYHDNTTNQLAANPIFLYSKKDLMQFFTQFELSGSLIEDTPGNWFFSSPSDITTRAVNYFMALEYQGAILHITADGVAPTVNSSVSTNDFANKVDIAGHPGFGLGYKMLIDGLTVFNGPVPSSVTDNNTFLTWLNANYSSYGAWAKAYDVNNYVTNFTLNSKGKHTVSILMGTEAGFLLKTNVKTAQTITFPAVPNQAHTGGNYTLLATSTSGLPISYVSSDPTKATIVNGNQLHPVAAGPTNITASQTGNTDYAAATPVVNAVTIT